MLVLSCCPVGQAKYRKVSQSSIRRLWTLAGTFCISQPLRAALRDPGAAVFRLSPAVTDSRVKFESAEWCRKATEGERACAPPPIEGGDNSQATGTGGSFLASFGLRAPGTSNSS